MESQTSENKAELFLKNNLKELQERNIFLKNQIEWLINEEYPKSGFELKTKNGLKAFKHYIDSTDFTEFTYNFTIDSIPELSSAVKPFLLKDIEFINTSEGPYRNQLNQKIIIPASYYLIIKCQIVNMIDDKIKDINFKLIYKETKKVKK